MVTFVSLASRLRVALAWQANRAMHEKYTRKKKKTCPFTTFELMIGKKNCQRAPATQVYIYIYICMYLQIYKYIYTFFYTYIQRYLERVRQEATTSSLKCWPWGLTQSPSIGGKSSNPSCRNHLDVQRCGYITAQASSWLWLKRFESPYKTIQNTCSYNPQVRQLLLRIFWEETNTTNWNNYINCNIQLDKHKIDNSGFAHLQAAEPHHGWTWRGWCSPWIGVKTNQRPSANKSTYNRILSRKLIIIIYTFHVMLILSFKVFLCTQLLSSTVRPKYFVASPASLPSKMQSKPRFGCQHSE